MKIAPARARRPISSLTLERGHRLRCLCNCSWISEAQFVACVVAVAGEWNKWAKARRAFRSRGMKSGCRGQLRGRVGPRAGSESPLGRPNWFWSARLEDVHQSNDIFEEREWRVGNKKPERRRDVWGARRWRRPRKGDACRITSRFAKTKLSSPRSYLTLLETHNQLVNQRRLNTGIPHSS